MLDLLCWIDGTKLKEEILGRHHVCDGDRWHCPKCGTAYVIWCNGIGVTMDTVNPLTSEIIKKCQKLTLTKPKEARYE